MELALLLYQRFTLFYGEQFTKRCPTPDLIKIWADDWADGLIGVEPDHIKQALYYCKMNLEWPPSLAHFRRLCENAAGLPDLENAWRLVIQGKLDIHPVVRNAFDKIGSYYFKHDSEKELRKKFRYAYLEARDEYRKEKILSLIKKDTIPLESSTIHQENINRIGASDIARRMVA